MFNMYSILRTQRNRNKDSILIPRQINHVSSIHKTTRKHREPQLSVSCTILSEPDWAADSLKHRRGYWQPVRVESEATCPWVSGGPLTGPGSQPHWWPCRPREGKRGQGAPGAGTPIPTSTGKSNEWQGAGRGRGGSCVSAVLIHAYKKETYVQNLRGVVSSECQTENRKQAGLP